MNRSVETTATPTIPTVARPNQANASGSPPLRRIRTPTADIHTRNPAKPNAPIFADTSQSSFPAAVRPEVTTTTNSPPIPTSVGSPTDQRDPGAWRS